MRIATTVNHSRASTSTASDNLKQIGRSLGKQFSALSSGVSGEALVRQTLDTNPQALSVHRANKYGDPKDIHASIDGHTQDDVVDYSAVVEDVYSQYTSGDCLPTLLQEHRADLKSRAPNSDAAAQELAELDQAIVEGTLGRPDKAVTFEGPGQVYLQIDNLKVEIAELRKQVVGPFSSEALALIVLQAGLARIDTLEAEVSLLEDTLNNADLAMASDAELVAKLGSIPSPPTP